MAVATFALAGCGNTSKEDLLPKAESLVLEAKWAEAIPVLKQHLLTHPNDSGAHFYLGRCFLNVQSEVPMLVFALGELETALNLFTKRGHPNTIERFSDTYFELICHIERTKVYLKQVNFLLMQDALPRDARLRVLRRIMDRCEEELEAAKGIQPDSPDVENLERIIRRLRQNLGFSRDEQPDAADGGFVI